MAEAAAGILLEGDVWLARRNPDDTYENYVSLFAGKLALKHNNETKDITSKQKGKYGQVLASVVVPKPTDLSLTFSSVSPKALAMGLQGTAGAYSQAASGATPVALVQGAKSANGTSIKLDYRNINGTGLSVKSTETTPTTYAKDIDYTVDYAGGYVHILASSTIPDGMLLDIKGTYSAISGDKIIGGTAPNVRGMLRLEGANLVDGRGCEFIAYDVSLSSDSEIDWLSDKPIDISMKGRMMTPEIKTGPYELNYNLIAA
ncbi:MAG: hypothetical protein EPN21_13230 [Methylococcaceae bacterium]|nr:MAG: hypothetical protein EPN21_13230 [Methylococcaceae bacterium]